MRQRARHRPLRVVRPAAGPRDSMGPTPGPRGVRPRRPGVHSRSAEAAVGLRRVCTEPTVRARALPTCLLRVSNGPISAAKH